MLAAGDYGVEAPMECLSCGVMNPPTAERCHACRELMDPDAFDDARVGYTGMIPTRNPQALTSYYLGILSFIPVLGLVLGIAAIVLGMRGREAAKERPEIKGGGHALIGIVAGWIFVILHLVVFAIIAYYSN